MRLKAALFLICFSTLVRADQTLFNDTFNSPLWRAVNTEDYAKVEKKVLKLADARRYIPTTKRRKLQRGSRLRFEIEGRGAGKAKIALFCYAKKITQFWGDEFELTADFAPHSIEYELPEAIHNVRPVIMGEGEYRKATLTHLFDPDFKLVAKPPYQMVSGPPIPVVFQLFHKGALVTDAQIAVDGTEAFHRASGATASAWVDQGDTTPFDKVAKNIRLSRPLKILYLGDSLTHFDLGHNHVDKTAFFLNKYNPEMVESYNYAVGGDYITRVVDRLKGNPSVPRAQHYADIWSRAYDMAFIFLGHNDTKASSAGNYTVAVVPPEQQREFYEELIGILRKHGVKRIVLMSASSSNYEICKANAQKSKRPVHYRFGEPKHMEAFNNVLRQLAKAHSLEYFDVYDAMKNLPGKAELLNPNDGVHLSEAGHDFIALETLKYLLRNP